MEENLTEQEVKEKLDKLKEYEKLDAEGRLVVLPIPFGEYFYLIWDMGEDFGYENMVEATPLTGIDCKGNVMTDYEEATEFVLQKDTDGVFFSMEEALAEARKMNEAKWVPKFHYQGTSEKSCHNCKHYHPFDEATIRKESLWFADGKRYIGSCRSLQTKNKGTNEEYVCRYWESSQD